MSQEETIIKLAEKIVVVRCFDDRIDVPLHALYKKLKNSGCKKVREMKLAGGAISFVSHLDFAYEQIETFIDRGFAGIMLTTHTACHHVATHRMIPKKFTENKFLGIKMITGIEEIHARFPELNLYACIIETEKADCGMSAVEHLFCSQNEPSTFYLYNPLVCPSFIK